MESKGISDRVQNVKGKEIKGRTEAQNKCPCHGVLTQQEIDVEVQWQKLQR